MSKKKVIIIGSNEAGLKSIMNENAIVLGEITKEDWKEFERGINEYHKNYDPMKEFDQMMNSTVERYPKLREALEKQFIESKHVKEAPPVPIIEDRVIEPKDGQQKRRERREQERRRKQQWRKK